MDVCTKTNSLCEQAVYLSTGVFCSNGPMTVMSAVKFCPRLLSTEPLFSKSIAWDGTGGTEDIRRPAYASQWIYENEEDNRTRYVLGVPGTRPLFCFGINASTATPSALDPTLQSVVRLSRGNEFDGWIMFNVYPQRATNPNDLHKELDVRIHKKNLEHIEAVLKDYERPVLWGAWGTLIGKRGYLKGCLLDILSLSEKYDCAWVRIGKLSRDGHPHHPLYLRQDEKYKEFAIENYIESLTVNRKGRAEGK